MADHRAEQIMAAVKTNITGLATTATRVYRGRTYPIEESQVPALLLYQADDEPQQDDAGGAVYQHIDRMLHFVIEAVVQTANLDTLLNQIRKEVTIALMASRTQGLAFVINTFEGTAERPRLFSEAKKRHARAVLNWRIRYRTSRTDPSQ